MNHQGEVAVMIEKNELDGSMQIVGYALPRDKKSFTPTELRNTYLAQAVMEKKVEDPDREIVHKFLYQTSREQGASMTQSSPRGQFGPREVDEKGVPVVSVYAGKKYKPVALKVKPVYQELPDKYRIKRDIKGNPLAEMPPLNPRPSEFVPTGRYTKERRDKIDEAHPGDFLLPEERKLLHEVMMNQNEGFAWDDTEKGKFKEEYFPPIEIPVVEHSPWVLKNIPIPPGMHDQVMEFIRTKIKAGTYEASNSSYRSRWFTVMKKDQKSFRIVHSLEPLNAVTIAHSGIPPGADDLAEHFSGRACGGILDLYVGYDERLLAESSRDMTTFQTPFGALRLVTLPMGWTNSVPIFHDDVTYILKDEMPDYTKPYIDDVPIRGPATRYELGGGKYETIPENEGIRRFVWEHMQAVNRIIQRMKYAGGTFSGYKSVLCAAEITVVGHLCTYEGRKPGVEKLWAISNWGPCKTVSDLRSFMGTIGLLRIYITDYAARAENLQKLLRGKVPFVWGPEQEESMRLLKEGAASAQCIKPIDYSKPGNIVLAVDTSWRAVGFYIYHEDPENSKKREYARFGSILLQDREQRFSQPKRELFGLLRALQACYYWLIGVRKLVVESDAKYLKGMLEHPGLGPNATVNRWIDTILMFHFELRHVAGKTFGADGLSRREGQPGDEQYFNSEENEDEEGGLVKYSKKFASDPDPLEFEDFKHEIDNRGGYIQEVQTPVEVEEEISDLARSVEDFAKELEEARCQYQAEQDMVRQCIKEDVVPTVQRQYLEEFLLQETAATASYPLVYNEKPTEEDAKSYDESNRTYTGKLLDDRIPLLREWLRDTSMRPNGMTEKDYFHFKRAARNFFLDDKGRLYRKGLDGAHRLFVEKNRRVGMLKGAHESLGHRGSYSTRELLVKRFWWPELERDVYWHVKTCQKCQERQKALYQIPRTETFTPAIFQQVHVDTLLMTPQSNGCRYIAHARCALTSWPEARALAKENWGTISKWLFEDIICRWGCVREFITDNGGPFVKALKILEDKYGIRGIQISPHNSRANGKIERGHWDLRQMLYKATGQDHLAKWFWFLAYVLWADRVSTRKGFGCSPFFMVTGAQPVLPLDIQEATWLVELPDRMLTTEELIGFRARALSRHKVHVEEMRARVSKIKRDALARWEQKSRYKIKSFSFKPGDLVLVRNSGIEQSLNRKMLPRYLGPMIVIARKRGGAYILAEMNGNVSQWQIAAFKVIPYFARRNIKLPANIHEVIDQTAESLKEIMDKEEDPEDEEYVYEDIDDMDFDILDEPDREHDS